MSESVVQIYKIFLCYVRFSYITVKIYCYNNWHGSKHQINALLLRRFHTQINHWVIQLCPNTNEKGINLSAVSGSILVTESEHLFISNTIQLHKFKDARRSLTFLFYELMCVVFHLNISLLCLEQRKITFQIQQFYFTYIQYKSYRWYILRFRVRTLFK